MVFLAANEGRLFGLDMQLLFGMVFQMISILILFVTLTYILYEPVRKVLDDRKQRIASDVADAKWQKAEAEKCKAEYEGKLKKIEEEADILLSEARKKALAKEREILANAKTEAGKILTQAKRDVRLEENRAKEELKGQMIEVATLMAGKIITFSLNEEDRANLVQDTIKEMGEITWLS